MENTPYDFGREKSTKGFGGSKKLLKKVVDETEKFGSQSTLNKKIKGLVAVGEKNISIEEKNISLNKLQNIVTAMEDTLKIYKNSLDICQKILLVKEFSLEEFKKSLKKKGEIFSST